MNMEAKVGFGSLSALCTVVELSCRFPGTHHGMTLFTLLLNLTLFLHQRFCHSGFFEAIFIFFLQLDLLLPILGQYDRVA